MVRKLGCAWSTVWAGMEGWLKHMPPDSNAICCGPKNHFTKDSYFSDEIISLDILLVSFQIKAIHCLCRMKHSGSCTTSFHLGSSFSLYVLFCEFLQSATTASFSVKRKKPSLFPTPLNLAPGLKAHLAFSLTSLSTAPLSLSQWPRRHTAPFIPGSFFLNWTCEKQGLATNLQALEKSFSNTISQTVEKALDWGEGEID